MSCCRKLSDLARWMFETADLGYDTGLKQYVPEEIYVCSFPYVWIVWNISNNCFRVPKMVYFRKLSYLIHVSTESETIRVLYDPGLKKFVYEAIYDCNLFRDWIFTKIWYAFLKFQKWKFQKVPEMAYFRKLFDSIQVWNDTFPIRSGYEAIRVWGDLWLQLI